MPISSPVTALCTLCTARARSLPYTFHASRRIASPTMACSECGGITLPGQTVCRDCTAEGGGGVSLRIAVVCLGTVAVGGWAVFLGALLSLISSSTFVTLFGLLVAAIGIGQLAVVYGLWHARSWARGWAIVLHGSNVLAGLVNFGLHDHGASLLAVSLSSIIAIYVYVKKDLYLA